MIDQKRARATEEALPKTRQDMQDHAVKLTALAEGMAVLVTAADGPRDDTDVRFAGNALYPLAEEIAARAQVLASALDGVNQPEGIQ